MGKPGQYTRLEKRAREGDRSWLVEPLDYLLLQELPDEGTNIGGLYQLGTTIEAIAKKYDGLTSGVASGRIRAMNLAGMTKKVKMVAGGNGGKYAWQITPFGKEVLEKWLATQKQR